MGVSKTVTVICDYSECKGSKNGPAVLSWNETNVGAGREEAPEAAKYLVILSVQGVQRAFCCQLHAAEFFLPPGYEAKQKQIIALPTTDGPKDVAPQATWMDLPRRSEGDPVEQADGSGPEDIA